MPLSAYLAARYRQIARLSKRMRPLSSYIGVLRRFMLAFHEIDVNQLERDLLLAQNNTNATRGGRLASSVELENHCDEM